MGMFSDGMDEVMDELRETKKELSRIKDGIKRCQGTMIIDGNDMFDWGWTTLEIQNKELYKRGMHPFSWVQPMD